MVDLRTFDTFPDGSLAAGWEKLVRADPTATIFHSARFLDLWCRYLRGSCDLRLRVASENGQVVGVVPEVREHDRTRHGQRTVVQFAGGYHVTDYLGPISLPDRRASVVDAWFAALQAEGDWDELVAGGLAEDAGWHLLIAERAAADGYQVAGPETEDVSPRIDLRGGWDAYLARLNGKQRHEIRRKARKIAREASVAKLVAVEPDELPAAMEEFISLHRRSAGEKGRFFVDEATDAFFHALAEEFGPDRILRLHRLDVDGRPGAMAISLVDGPAGGSADAWGLYNSAFECDLAALSPGMVLVGELIRIAGDEGFDVFDLLRGDEPYKYRFGAVPRQIQRVAVRKR